MKKYFLILVTIVIIATVLFSCSKEEDSYKACYKRYGKLKARFSDSLEIDFQRVSLENLSDSTIAISAAYLTDDCLLRTTVNFFKLKKESSVQPLLKYDWGVENFEDGSTLFQTYDNADALTERFLLYEGEPHWLQFTELGEEKVKGRFQATYVYRQSINRYWNLPDTLHFNNVEFEAVIFTGTPFTY